MILRDNWKATEKYLDYRSTVLQNDSKTVRSGRIALKHILQWLDDVPLRNAAKVRPTLPEHLLHARNDGKPIPLSPVHMAKVLTWARGLFEWLRMEHPSVYRPLSPIWINSLQVRRSASVQSRLVRRQFWTLDEALRIAAYDPTSLREKRDRAALCFIFLSGMRGGAFVTLPVRAVDLPNMRVLQLPELGVKTKNSKAAITHLFPIPGLLQVVVEWDTFIRASVAPSSAWYASLDPFGLAVVSGDVQDVPISGRRNSLYSGLRDLCGKVGIEWKSPHKIRHGHGVYGLKKARTMEEYRAHSQNMMHESTATTDRYSELLNDEVGNIISTFTPDK